MIALNFKPQKPTDLNNLSAVHASVLHKKSFICSKKYDGHMVWIVKEGQRVRFFTSDWKEFFISSIALQLLCTSTNFIVAGELLFGCEGKLGSRGKSAVTTTFRTNYSKGLPNGAGMEGRVNIRLFDCIYYNTNRQKTPYIDRLVLATAVAKYSNQLNIIDWGGRYSFELCRALAKQWFDEGWEGAVIHEADASYVIGKRAPYAVKLKFRRTADLLCIGVEAGLGKCNGIGSVVLQDKIGRIVKVGSGLDYSGNTRDGSDFIGRVIEIEYEQIMDTYIQPSFICIRDDKTKEEID